MPWLFQFRVILGWPFSILAFLPVVIYSLVKRFKQAFISGAVTSIFILGFSVVVDYYYYKRWTSSVLILLIYNVLGGGESHLYGTEGALFYIRNGFHNFNFCFVLAIYPVIRRKYDHGLLVFISPMYIWLAFMSLQPQKEERFLYPIYPLICVSASAVIENIPELFREKSSGDYNQIPPTCDEAFYEKCCCGCFHGYEKKNIPKDEALIVSCCGCFHGRTLAVISMSCDNDATRGFVPLLHGNLKIESLHRSKYYSFS